MASTMTEQTLTVPDVTLPQQLSGYLDGATASTALLTDRYELTMLAAALRDGTASHRAVFEVFARSLPAGRGYGVLAGLGRVLDAVEAFRFTDEQLTWLTEAGVIDQATRQYLTGWRFTGHISAYREGELYFPYSPVLTVEGTFGDAVLLETVILSILNHDSAIASAAARMVSAAGGRALLEMGGRRTGEQSAVAAARAAYLAGFDATSNLEAGMRYGVPTVGTAAHAFTLAHASEQDAFASQVAALGVGTSLLVDTYDIAEGIRRAVAAAGPDLGAVRIDSGDLAQEARRARALLDDLGATRTRIAITGDLDEHAIAALADAPVDTYGVGTKLVTGSGAPTCGFVYKLVAVADSPAVDAPMRPVAKKSASKASVGGRKVAYRELDRDGHAVAEKVLTRYVTDGVVESGRALQERYITDGRVVRRESLAQIRAHHRAAKTELISIDTTLAPTTPRLTGQRG